MDALAADRDLLFGMLALQNGLINQVQLVAAFQAWTLDKARALADHLVGRGDLDADDRSAVEALVARHLKKHGGDAEKSLAAIPAGRSTRESLAAIGDPAIEHTLTRLASASDDDPDRTATVSVGSATSEGQRFRILRRHAKGGLGAVFVALDAELNREVALKQILDRLADDAGSRHRFVLEAEITGGLEHPGIVPVYGLGSYGGGRPYYAMRFIRGDSLKEAIDDFHKAFSSGNVPAGSRDLALRKLLRRFIDVCNAIDYAHSRGVIHRDIKPANIVVGKYGETLVVDWGLAKPMGRVEPGTESGERLLMLSSASGSSETLPGSTLGTPAYMSPEQAEGQLERLGPRSDVYSLGATLYCLLTGQPPFTGDIVDVIRAVQKGEFLPPRQVDASIDPALEAICLKAMSNRPEDRYASSRALADDLDRWMADEPVTAWNEPFSRRARRWARRNRTAVTAAAVALVAGVVGLAAVLVVQTQAKADIARALIRESRANTALAAANEELSRSRAAVLVRYDLAVEAIKTFHTGVSEDFLLKQDQFKDLRDRLLNSAADFYGKLGALLGKETDVASRRALEQSNFELAELTRKVGRIEAALAAHHATLAAREALAAETAATTGIKADVGRSLTAVANLLYATGKVDEALAAYRRAESLLAGLASSDPEARSALATSRTRMSRPLHHGGKSALALAACKLARSDLEALATGPGASNVTRYEFADTLNELGIVLWQTGKPAEAEPEFRTALAIQQKLADDNPGNTNFRVLLANSRVHLGNVLKLTGKVSEAEAEFRVAMAIYQKLADENPAVISFRRNLALCHNDFGALLFATARLSDAEAEHRTAMAIEQKLAEDNPGNTDVRVLLADSHRSLGQLLFLAGKLSEAEVEYRTALAINQKLAGDDLNKSLFQFLLASNHGSLGYVLLVAGKRSHAEAECRRALAINQKLADENPEDNAYCDALAGSLNCLGAVVRSVGRLAEAKRGYEQAIALLEQQVQQNPTDPWHRYFLASSIRQRGLTLGDLGDPVGAAADARRALVLCDGPGPGSVENVVEMACCHAALAGLAGRARSGVSVAEGEKEARASIEWLRRAIAMGYRNGNELRIESALDPLRTRDDFRLLMMDLAMPAQAFAAAR